MNTAVTAAAPVIQKSFGNGLRHLYRWPERIPYSLIALIARAAAVTVFLRAGLTKLDDWDSTLALFMDEYRVPLLSPVVAAYLAASLELGGSALMALGLMTRFAALAFIMMIAVIQVFVYPSAWPDHIQWLAFLTILLARGPGLLSVDALIEHWNRRKRS